MRKEVEADSNLDPPVYNSSDFATPQGQTGLYPTPCRQATRQFDMAFSAKFPFEGAVQNNTTHFIQFRGKVHSYLHFMRARRACTKCSVELNICIVINARQWCQLWIFEVNDLFIGGRVLSCNYISLCFIYSRKLTWLCVQPCELTCLEVSQKLFCTEQRPERLSRTEMNAVGNAPRMNDALLSRRSRVKENGRASRQTGGQSNHHKWLASRKIWSVEELETFGRSEVLRSLRHCPRAQRMKNVYMWNIKSTYKGSKYVTRVQQQRPESPMVTLTWHACKYKVYKLHQKLRVWIISYPRRRSAASL